jgi:hypothetical protein
MISHRLYKLLKLSDETWYCRMFRELEIIAINKVIFCLFAALFNNENVEDTSSNFTLPPTLRRVTSGRVRDNKLLMVLNARRRTPNRWRSTEECEHHCQAGNNHEYCKLKCSRDMKLTLRNGGKIQTASEPTYVNEMSTSVSNLAMQSHADEFLDTEESVHGFSFADPSNGTNGNKQTKESSNLISNNAVRSRSTESKKEIIYKTSSETTIPSVTVKASRRNKYMTTSLSPSDIRSTVYRGRVKFSPSNIKSSLEEVDADPYLYIGQKLASSTIRIPDTRRQLGGGRRNPYQSTTPSRSKEEELEIMEVSVAKQSSTEKNKYWKTRNIVAINNYMRRLNPHVSGSSKVTENTTKLTTVRYETIHTQPKEGQTATSISAEGVNNLAEGVDDVKNVFSRSTTNSSYTESPKQIETIYRPLPSLIINVPDDATPIFFSDPRNYEQSDGELESSPTETNSSEEISTTITSNQKKSSKLPDINRLFENLTTVSTSPKFSNERSKVQTTTLHSTISSSTTTSVVKSTLTSTESSYIPPKTTKRVYTTIPRRKPAPTTVFPDYNRTTISTFLSNISSRRNKGKNETVSVATSSTTFTPTSSTVPYKTFSTKTSSPIDIEMVAPPSVTPESFTPSVQTNVFFQGVLTTNKPLSNEVLVEMQKVNVATYVMAGLGLLPLVVILIYVVRQYLYRHEHKDGDLENYGNDIQPISPVVTLDQSDDGASIDGGESIISETDFNRSDLRFKSLLGEGNFGQVWKGTELNHFHKV